MKQEIIQRPPDTPFRESLWIFPLQIQEHLPFTLCSAGITLRDPNYRIRRENGAHYYVLECILSGQGHLKVAGHSVHPKTGDVYLLPLGIPNEYYTDRKNPWEKIWFNISGGLIDSLVACYHLDGMIYIANSNMQEMFRHGMEIVRQCRPNAPVEFAAQLTRIFATLADLHAKSATASPSMKLAQSLRNYLDEHWREPYSLTKLSSACDKSPAQIMRIFSSTWKCTPKTYHTKTRFSAASRYLENTSEQIRTIADWLGFANEFQFSTWFKKHSGCSPRQFRDKL